MKSLLILKSKERIKEIFTDMKASDVYKIVDAVQKMESSPKPKTPTSKEKKTPTTREEKIRAMLKVANLRPVDSQKKVIEDSVEEMHENGGMALGNLARANDDYKKTIATLGGIEVLRNATEIHFSSNQLVWVILTTVLKELEKGVY